MRQAARVPTLWSVVGFVFASIVLMLAVGDCRILESHDDFPRFHFSHGPDAGGSVAGGVPVTEGVCSHADVDGQYAHCPYDGVRTPAVLPRADSGRLSVLLDPDSAAGTADWSVHRLRGLLSIAASYCDSGRETLLRFCIWRL